MTDSFLAPHQINQTMSSTVTAMRGSSIAMTITPPRSSVGTNQRQPPRFRFGSIQPQQPTLTQSSNPVINSQQLSIISRINVLSNNKPTTLKGINDLMKAKSIGCMHNSEVSLKALQTRIDQFSPSSFRVQTPSPSSIQVASTLLDRDSQSRPMLPMCPNIVADPIECCSESHFQEFCHQSGLTHSRPTRNRCALNERCPEQTKIEHLALFYHEIAPRVEMCAFQDQSNVDCRINHTKNIDRIQSFLRAETKSDSPIEIPTAFKEFVRGLRPCHRLTVDRLRSVIKLGYVMSTSEMKTKKTPTQIVAELHENPTLAPLRLEIISQVKSHQSVDEYIKTYGEYIVFLRSNRVRAFPEECMSMQHIVLDMRGQLLSTVKETDLDTLERSIVEIVHCLVFAFETTMGTGFKNDVILGTHQHVFSILGPNTGSSYGGIAIIFKRDILSHPNSNVTMCAGTSFFTGAVHQFKQYLGEAAFYSNESRIKTFHESKMHPTAHGFEDVMALELMAQMHYTTPFSYQTAKTVDIMKWWYDKNSHGVFEAHLPSKIPMSAIATIIVPAPIFDEVLTAPERKFLCDIVGAANIVRLEQVQPDEPHADIINERQLLSFISRFTTANQLANADNNTCLSFRLPAIKSSSVQLPSSFPLNMDCPTNLLFQLHSQDLKCSLKFDFNDSSSTSTKIVLSLSRTSMMIHSHQLNSNSPPKVTHLHFNNTVKGLQEISFIVSISKHAMTVELAGKTRAFDRTTTTLQYDFHRLDPFISFRLSIHNQLGNHPLDVNRLVISSASKHSLSPTHPLLPYSTQILPIIDQHTKKAVRTESLAKRRRTSSIGDDLDIIQYQVVPL